MQIGLAPECLMWSVNSCTVFLKGVPEKMYYIPTALPLSPSLTALATWASSLFLQHQAQSFPRASAHAMLAA